MEDFARFQNVLAVFAHHGFRKTSMVKLAEAAGVSRQTLYNRLQDKEAVLDWAVRGIVELAHAHAEAALHAPGVESKVGLVQAMCRKMGEFVPMLHESPHGWEVMDKGMASLARADINTEARFEHALVHFLLDRHFATTVDQAHDQTFTLIVAGKGLMMKCSTQAAFRAGIGRIVDVVFSTTPHRAQVSPEPMTHDP